MPKKILVVDDEKPISDIIKFNLTKEGFDVDTAYDGEEAVKKVDEYDRSISKPKNEKIMSAKLNSRIICAPFMWTSKTITK